MKENVLNLRQFKIVVNKKTFGVIIASDADFKDAEKQARTLTIKEGIKYVAARSFQAAMSDIIGGISTGKIACPSSNIQLS